MQLHSELTLEQNLLLHLLRRGLLGESEPLDAEAWKDADWGEVCKEAVQQAVPVIAFDVAAEYKKQIPQNLYRYWLKLSGGTLQANERITHAQKELIAWLKEAGYTYLILKGTSAAAYYPKPENRGYGDVDFLVQEDCVKAVGKLLKEKGCKKESVGGHHIAYARADGVHLELHFAVGGIPYGERGEKIKAFLANILQTSQTVKSGLTEFVAPSDEKHAMVLILHMLSHMLGEGMGLRHLCDFACFLNKTHEKAFWGESLLPLLKDVGLYTYVQIMTKTCALYLGSVLPSWAADADESVCLEVLKELFVSGNFGGKDFKRAKSAMLISERGKAGMKHGKVYNLCHGLHNYTKAKHPVCQKCFLLYPIFYIGEMVRYGWLMIRGKRPSPLSMTEEADARKAVYEKLHIYEE